MNLSLTVLGIVQGVGFRPFAAGLAEELGLSGFVRNQGGVVRILLSGSPAQIDEYCRRLQTDCPPEGHIDRLLKEERPDSAPEADFVILPSEGEDPNPPLLPPDIGVCDKCLAELENPADRRRRYPFISCVDCGPRYSILRSIPYDRDTITMDIYKMCPACESEYRGRGRRRHAQTISCRDCGPELILTTPVARELRADAAFDEAVALLSAGRILALKAIGGYQLACLPENKEAVDRLRDIKNRDRKPFAVMFPDIDSLRKVCSVSDAEKDLLLSPAKPIVLLSPVGQPFPYQVSCDSRLLGAFLPNTGLHHMLTRELGPLIMTSANLAGQPIVFRDAEASELLRPRDGSDNDNDNGNGTGGLFVDGVLRHTREILTPLDDSVVRVHGGRTNVIRRARGYVPQPVRLGVRVMEPVLATGGDLKSVFCLLREQNAYLSSSFGDLESREAEENIRAEMRRMTEIFGHPARIAADLHPRYFSGEIAREVAESFGISPERITYWQHHHAHAASVMAEHRLAASIGISFDGTGYGPDGAIWGGEFLICRGAEYERKGHLGYVRMAGGDETARRADSSAFFYLAAAGIPYPTDDAELLAAAIGVPGLFRESGSVGRLFDAIGAVLHLSGVNHFEGETAILTENAAARALAAGKTPYPLSFPWTKTPDGIILDAVTAVAAVDRAVRLGADIDALSLGFHLALADSSAQIAGAIRDETGVSDVTLSGGVFANEILTDRLTERLLADGFAVYTNKSVPGNDGGLALGQAYLTALAEGRNELCV